MQRLAPEAYAKFEKLALKQLGNKYLLDTAARYKAAGVDIDAEGIIQEAVADYSGALFEGGDALDNFIAMNKNDRGLLRGMLDAVRGLADDFTGREREQARIIAAKLNDAIKDVNLENENNIDTVGEMPYTETRYRVSDKNRSSREADARKERLIRDFSGKVNVDYAEMYMDDQEKAMVRSAIKSGNGVLSSNNRKGRVFAYDSYYIFNFNEDNSVTIIERLVADDDRIDEYEEAFFKNEERTTGFNSDRNAKRDRSVSGRRIHDNADVSQQAGEVDGIRTVDTTELRRTQNYGSGNGVGISDGSGGIDSSKNQADLGSNLETTSYETEKQGPTLTDDRGGLFVQNEAEQFSIKDPDAEKNTARTDGERYSIAPTLKNDISAVRNGTFPKDAGEVVIGTTSEFLVDKLKLNPLMVSMPQNKMYAAMVTEDVAKAEGKYDGTLHYHNLGEDLLFEVLEASEHPIAAFVDENGIDKNGNIRD